MYLQSEEGKVFSLLSCRRVTRIGVDWISRLRCRSRWYQSNHSQQTRLHPTDENSSVSCHQNEREEMLKTRQGANSLGHLPCFVLLNLLVDQLFIVFPILLFLEVKLLRRFTNFLDVRFRNRISHRSLRVPHCQHNLKQPEARRKSLPL